MPAMRFTPAHTTGVSEVSLQSHSMHPGTAHPTPGVVIALNIGRVSEITSEGSGGWWDKDWQTGFYKAPQTAPCWLGYGGFRGDEQADRRHHGGVDKAVCVYPAEHYAGWRDALPVDGLPHGAFGENLTVSGLVEEAVCVGDVFKLGEAQVQVSQPRQPCWKLARRWRVKDLTARVEQTGLTGYYFRVLHHGHVSMGDALVLQQRSFPQWTIARCNDIMHHQKGDAEAALALSGCPLLSASWKDGLWARAQRSTTAAALAKDARTTQPA